MPNGFHMHVAHASHLFSYLRKLQCCRLLSESALNPCLLRRLIQCPYQTHFPIAISFRQHYCRLLDRRYRNVLCLSIRVWHFIFSTS